MKLENFLARRYLSSHRGRGLSVITWIALAGVVVGVMSLVCVLAVMSGFDKSLREKILGNNAHLTVSLMTPAGDKQAFEAVLQNIEKVEGVKSAMPIVYGEGFVLGPQGGSQGVAVKGVDPVRAKIVLDINDYLESDNWQDFEGDGAILGSSLGHALHILPGDHFTLVLNRGEFSPFGLVPRMKKLRVADLFHSGFTAFDSRYIYVTLDEAERLFEISPRLIEIRTTDVRHIADVAKRIASTVPEIDEIHDWLEENRDILSALKLEKTAMGVILALIVLVASFNICGSLIMVVKDKTKDIAILKSMGALDSTILRIFFYQGIFIGAVGTAVGLVLGVIMSLVLRDYVHFPLNKEVYMIDTLPVDIRVTDLVLVMVGALVISSVATLYPARLAARIIPTEGLKAD